MKLTITKDNVNIVELDSENMSEEQITITDKEITELLVDKEVLEWKLKFKDGLAAYELANLGNIGEFVIEQVITLK